MTAISVKIASLSTVEQTTTPWATVLAMCLAVGMALIHVIQTFVFVLPAGQFKNLHLGLALLILILGFLEKTRLDKTAQRLWFALLFTLTLAIVIYIHIEYEDLVNVRAFKASLPDLIVAVLLFCSALYDVNACRLHRPGPSGGERNRHEIRGVKHLPEHGTNIVHNLEESRVQVPTTGSVMA